MDVGRMMDVGCSGREAGAVEPCEWLLRCRVEIVALEHNIGFTNVLNDIISTVKHWFKPIVCIRWRNFVKPHAAPVCGAKKKERKEKSRTVWTSFLTHFTCYTIHKRVRTTQLRQPATSWCHQVLLPPVMSVLPLWQPERRCILSSSKHMEAMTKHHFQQEVQGFVILVQGTSKTLEASRCVTPHKTGWRT